MWDILIPARLRAFRVTGVGGCYEFACYAEAVIVTDEYHAWAAAKAVPDYLEVFSPSTDYPFAWPGKLATYWNSAE